MRFIKRLSTAAIMVFFLLIAVNAQSVIPLGTWNYGVYIGKTRIGTASATTTLVSGQYISTTDMTMKLSEAIITSREITKETESFVPISYFSSTTSILNDKATRDIITADFNGSRVTLKRSGEVIEVDLKGPFIISGNKLLAEFIAKKPAADLEVKMMTYCPAFEEDQLISISEKIIGKETIVLPSGKAEVWHTVQTLGPVRNIHNYINSKGTVYKTTLSMLNITMDLVLESYKEAKSDK